MARVSDNAGVMFCPAKHNRSIIGHGGLAPLYAPGGPERGGFWPGPDGTDPAPRGRRSGVELSGAGRPLFAR